MAEIKTVEYGIVINGVKESADAVEDLKKKLEELSARIDAINQKTINVSVNSSDIPTTPATTTSASATKSRVSDLEAEERVLQQIEQTERKIAEAETDAYKELLKQKDALKEIKTEQKAFASAEKLGIDPSGIDTSVNSMAALKQQLKDLKAVINATDMNSPMFKDLVQKANELNTKLKDIEKEYGQFGRNVGNYGSAVEGFKQFTITVNGVERSFKDANTAAKQLKKELNTLSAQGKQNTKEFDELYNKVKNLESAFSDATRSSKAMDTALDMMQSFTAIGSVSNGFSSLFGFDNSAIQESIQKLVALQNVLQGIEKIRQQMSTQEGIGKILTKDYKRIDSWTYSMQRANVALRGTGTSARVAAVGIKTLGVAIKGLTTLGLAVAFEAALEGIKKLVNVIQDWVKGDADLIDEERLLEQEIEFSNKKIDERIDQLQTDYITGAITREELYKKTIEAQTQAINEQIIALDELAQKRLDSDTRQNLKGINANKGEDISSTWGLDIEADNLKELTAQWKVLWEAVEAGEDVVTHNQKTIGDWFKGLFISLDDTKEELTNVGQVAVGDFMKRYEHAMKVMQNDTKAGEVELQKLLRLMNSNEMMNNVLTHLDQYIPDKQVVAKLQNIINRIKTLNGVIDDFNQRTVQQTIRSEQLKIDAMKDGAAKREAQRQLDMKKELMDETLTAEDIANIKKKYSNKKEKDEKDANEKSLRNTKRHNKEILDAEQDLQKLRINNMKEGLTKKLTQLEEEKKAEIRKVTESGRLVNERIAEINKKYQQKEIDERKKWAENVQKVYEDLWTKVLSLNAENSKRNVELLENSTDELLKKQLENYAKAFNQGISSYGIPGSNAFGNGTLDLLGISSFPTYEIVNSIDEVYGAYKKINKASEEENKLLDEMISKYREISTESNKYQEKLSKANIYAAKEYAQFNDTYLQYKQMMENVIENEWKIDKVFNEYYNNAKEKYSKNPKAKGALEAYNNEIAELDKQKAVFIAEIEKRKKEIDDWYKPLKSELEEAIKNNQLSYGIIDVEKDKEKFQQDWNDYKKTVIAKYKELHKDLSDEQIESTLNEEFDKRFDNTNTGSITELYNQRLAIIKTYWQNVIATTIEGSKKEYNEHVEYIKKSNEIEKERAFKEYKTISADSKNARELELGDLKESFEKKKIDQKVYNSELIRITQKYNDIDYQNERAYQYALEQLKKKGSQDLLKIKNEQKEKEVKITEQALEAELQEYRDFQSALSELESRQPVINAWGLTNFKKTNANYRDLEKGYEAQVKTIKETRKDVQNKFNLGDISKDSYESINRELDRMLANIAPKIEQVKQKLSWGGQTQEFMQGLNQWVQEVGSSVNSILGSLSEIASNEYDRLIEIQDKYIDELQERYDKQKDITQEYADAVNSIEDELSTARGDRRQQLIDMLNAQMAAQRASLEQEKKIEKEREKAEEKKKKLEHDQAVAKKKMQLAQAAINTSMAISMAAVNTWPIPAIPMMALAAAAGAAQIAAIQSQNIPSYGEGGLLQGKSHKEGGIKVLGGRAEVEGGEYVINKQTTTRNIDLIEFINTKKKRVNLDDMIEFYGGKSTVRKNITSIRPKFADGGMLPTLRNDIDIDDRLVTAMEDYAKRPVQVAVVDIIDRTQAVNNVKVMAGIE